MANQMSAHAQKGISAFGIYGPDVQDSEDGDIPVDVYLLSLAAMLRIPVYMHNVAAKGVFHPNVWNAFGTHDPEGPTTAPEPTSARSTANVL